MNVNTELASNLQKLITLEPNLAQELQGAENTDQAIERLAAVAGRHGITLDATDLGTLSTAVSDQTRVMTAVQELMSKDEALVKTLETLDQTDESVKAIMASADRHGVALDADELATYLRLASGDGAPEELNDEALADVTGGIVWLPVLKVVGLVVGIVAGTASTAASVKTLVKD